MHVYNADVHYKIMFK